MIKVGVARNYTLRVKQRKQGNRFDRFIVPFYNSNMQVNLPPDLQAKLDRIAAQEGREPESLVNEAVERFVSYDEWFIRQVDKGLAQVERGEVFEHEEVVAKVENLIREKQRQT